MIASVKGRVTVIGRKKVHATGCAKPLKMETGPRKARKKAGPSAKAIVPSPGKADAHRQVMAIDHPRHAMAIDHRRHAKGIDRRRAMGIGRRRHAMGTVRRRRAMEIGRQHRVKGTDRRPRRGMGIGDVTSRSIACPGGGHDRLWNRLAIALDIRRDRVTMFLLFPSRERSADRAVVGTVL